MTKTKRFCKDGKVTTMAVESTDTTLSVKANEERSLADFAEALAELEFNDDLSAAGYALVQWAGNDCPWFVPHAVGPSEVK